MHTSHRIERLLDVQPRGQKWIQVHLPSLRRARPVLFERAGRRPKRDLVVLAGLVLLVCALVVTAGWMAAQIGRATAIAAVCNGDCSSVPLPSGTSPE